MASVNLIFGEFCLFGPTVWYWCGRVDSAVARVSREQHTTMLKRHGAAARPNRGSSEASMRRRTKGHYIIQLQTLLVQV